MVNIGDKFTYVGHDYEIVTINRTNNTCEISCNGKPITGVFSIDWVTQTMQAVSPSGSAIQSVPKWTAQGASTGATPKFKVGDIVCCVDTTSKHYKEEVTIDSVDSSGIKGIYTKVLPGSGARLYSAVLIERVNRWELVGANAKAVEQEAARLEPVCRCRGGGFYGHDNSCPMNGHYSKRSKNVWEN